MGGILSKIYRYSMHALGNGVILAGAALLILYMAALLGTQLGNLFIRFVVLGHF